MPAVLGIILARGGSKGIFLKNISIVCGRPLLAYTIDAALGAKSLDRVAVSTENEEIANIATELGVEVIMRPAEYATDTAPVDLALRHAVRTVEAQNSKVGIVVGLYANVPVRKEGIIDKVVEKLILSGADSVQTYAPYRIPPQRAYRIEGDRPIPLEPCHVPSYRRQDLVPAFHPNGAVFALRRDVLMETENIPGEKSAFFGTDQRAIVQSPLDAVDVDEPVDLLWAEFLMERLNKSSIV